MVYILLIAFPKEQSSANEKSFSLFFFKSFTAPFVVGYFLVGCVESRMMVLKTENFPVIRLRVMAGRETHRLKK